MRCNILLVTLVICFVHGDETVDSEEPPEGYYAFVESPSAVPPKVRPPPYTHVNFECKDLASKKSYVSVHNICGDLNKGQIPRNPMRQNVMGEPYPFNSKTTTVFTYDRCPTYAPVSNGRFQCIDPKEIRDRCNVINFFIFELIRNQTLKFLSKTLPVLKADDTLPKVTQIHEEESLDVLENNGLERRMERSESRKTRAVPDEPREPRKFCDGGGMFCTLYRAIQGDSPSPQVPIAERREEIGPIPRIPNPNPPTPCPAKVEYATPVFAKNYQGSWRYVVQIPYEGYFTQTVEVTRCLQARCHYLDGGCLSSPRWVSMLVAEIFYPNSDEYTTTTTSTTAPPVQDFQAYQQYLQKRAGVSATDGTNAENNTKLPHCDGHDEIGCFQVRLYYDWFLIPGSCKCWRPDYFARYVRRKPGNIGDL